MTVCSYSFFFFFSVFTSLSSHHVSSDVFDLLIESYASLPIDFEHWSKKDMYLSSFRSFCSDAFYIHLNLDSIMVAYVFFAMELVKNKKKKKKKKTEKEKRNSSIEKMLDALILLFCRTAW